MDSSAAYRVQLSTGLFSRVARNLNLGANGRSTVRRVAFGERKSERIQRALRAEFRRIERLVAAYEQRQQLKEAA